MNNIQEVLKNYRKWHKIEKNKDFKVIKKEFLQTHLLSGVKRVQIEPTNRCNFRCIMCPIEEIKSTSNLTLNEFELILSKLPKSVEKICLSGLGEPFLNKDYVKMVKVASEHYYVEVYTNGSLFDFEVLKYADEVNFSVDGISKEVLENIRRGVKRDRLLSMIKKVVKLSQKSKIHINFTANFQNYKEVKNIFEFAHLAGVDHVSIQAVANNFDKSNSLYKEFKSFVKKNEEIDWEYIVKSYYKNYNFSLTIWYPRRLKGFCSWGFSNVYINSNLEVIQCCQNVTNPIVFGSLKDESFDGIYKKMDWFRKAHLNNENLPICENCPY